MPGPNLAGLMQIIAERPNFEGRAAQSRKGDPDLRRALLRELEPAMLTALGAPRGFRFTDEAIADLLKTLFRRPTTPGALRKLRARTHLIRHNDRDD